MFISLMAVTAGTVLVRGGLMMHPFHHFPFLCLLVLALVTSRMKVRLPGLTGNMSVNLPFLFLAFMQLNLLEAAIIAFASTLVQSLPKHGEPLRPIRVLFNVSTVTAAAGIAYMVFHVFSMRSGAGHSLALLMSAGTYFFLNTLPVATIISLTEGAKVIRTWLGIAHLSFPYYVAGTGITSMVSKNGSIGWAVPFALLPVMLGIYRSYRTYFGQGMALEPQRAASCSAPLTKAKAAGAI